MASVQITQERYQITGDLQVFGAVENTLPAGAPRSQLTFPTPSPVLRPPPLPFARFPSYRQHHFIEAPNRFPNLVSLSSRVPFAFDTRSNVGVPLTPPSSQHIQQPLQLPPPPLQQQQPPRPLLHLSSASSSHGPEHILSCGSQRPLPPPARIPLPRVMHPVNFPPPQLRQQFNVFAPPQQLQKQHSIQSSTMMQQSPSEYGDNQLLYPNLQRLPPVRMPVGNRTEGTTTTVPVSPAAPHPTAVMIRQTRHVQQMPTSAQDIFVGSRGPPRIAPPPRMPFLSSFVPPQPTTSFVARPLRQQLPLSFNYMVQQQPFNQTTNISAASSSSYGTCPNDDNSLIHYPMSSSSNVISQPPPPGIMPPPNQPVSSSFDNVTHNSRHEVSLVSF